MGGIDSSVPADKLAVLSVKKRPAAPHASGQQGQRSESVAQQGGRGRLAKYRGREQLLNPSVFNMRKVRGAKIPSANGHASAYALAQVMEGIARSGGGPTSKRAGSRGGGAIFSTSTLNAARSPQRPPSPNQTPQREQREGSQLLDNAGAQWGLGFQLHEMRLPAGETSSLRDGSSSWRVKGGDAPGEVVATVGHAGMGGSVAVAVPELDLSIAVTTSLLDFNSEARRAVLGAVFSELGLEPPPSLLAP